MWGGSVSPPADLNMADWGCFWWDFTLAIPPCPADAVQSHCPAEPALSLQRLCLLLSVPVALLVAGAPESPGARRELHTSSSACLSTGQNGVEP